MLEQQQNFCIDGVLYSLLPGLLAHRAYDLTGDGGVLIRMALMMSPVAASTERLLEERASVLQEVRAW